MTKRLNITQDNRTGQEGYSSHVRMGSLSIFVLVVTICLAVLAVLSFSTAHSSLVMAQRQVEATNEHYAAERAAWEFVAALDETLHQTASNDAMELGSTAHVEEVDLGNGESDDVNVLMTTVFDALPRMCATSRDAVGGNVKVTARVNENHVLASFTSGNERVLTIDLSIDEQANLTIEAWKLSAAEHEEPVNVRLLIAD